MSEEVKESTEKTEIKTRFTRVFRAENYQILHETGVYIMRVESHGSHELELMEVFDTRGEQIEGELADKFIEDFKEEFYG